MISKDIKRNDQNSWVFCAKITKIQQNSLSFYAQVLRDAYEENRLLRFRGWLFDMQCNPNDIEKQDGFIYHLTFKEWGDEEKANSTWGGRGQGREFEAFVLGYKDAEKNAVLNDFQEGDIIHAFYFLYYEGLLVRASQPAYIYNFDTNHLIECFDPIRMVGITERGIFPRLSKNKLIEIMASHFARWREDEIGLLAVNEIPAQREPRIERTSDVPRYEKYSHDELVAGYFQSLLTGVSLLFKIGILVLAVGLVVYLYYRYCIWRSTWLPKFFNR